MHLLVDSTGLKLCGAGEWLVEKHGTKTRRSWRKLHIGMDAGTGEIVAAAPTTNEVDDASQVGSLLEQLDGPVASLTGDGAYDQDSLYRSVIDRDPEALVHRQIWVIGRSGCRCNSGTTRGWTASWQVGQGGGQGGRNDSVSSRVRSTRSAQLVVKT
jgi:hypothetical protein